MLGAMNSHERDWQEAMSEGEERNRRRRGRGTMMLQTYVKRQTALLNTQEQLNLDLGQFCLGNEMNFRWTL